VRRSREEARSLTFPRLAFPVARAAICWPLLAAAAGGVLVLAGALRLWVVLGSAHRLTPPHKPHNSLYVISDQGRIIDSYDKRFYDSTAAWRERAMAGILHSGDLVRDASSDDRTAI
jgi:predicted amidohydrolase